MQNEMISQQSPRAVFMAVKKHTTCKVWTQRKAPVTVTLWCCSHMILLTDYPVSIPSREEHCCLKIRNSPEDNI